MNVLNMSVDMCAVYIASMIDAEGSVIHQKKKYSRQVCIYNTEKELIINCQECLQKLGIESYVINTRVICKHGESLQLIVSGQRNLIGLYSFVYPYMAERKRKLFNDLVLSYKNRPNRIRETTH